MSMVMRSAVPFNCLPMLRGRYPQWQPRPGPALEQQSVSPQPNEHFGEQRTLANIVRRCSANEHEHTPLGVFVVRHRVRRQKLLACVQAIAPHKAAKTAHAQVCAEDILPNGLSSCRPYPLIPDANTPKRDQVLGGTLERLLLRPVFFGRADPAPVSLLAPSRDIHDLDAARDVV
jgi:hypothetical protein